MVVVADRVYAQAAWALMFLSIILHSVQYCWRTTQRIPADPPCYSASLYPFPGAGGQFIIRELLKS